MDESSGCQHLRRLGGAVSERGPRARSGRAHVAHRLGRHRGSEHDRLQPLGRAPRGRARAETSVGRSPSAGRRSSTASGTRATAGRARSSLLAASRDHVPLRGRDERRWVWCPFAVQAGVVRTRTGALLPRRPVRRLGRMDGYNWGRRARGAGGSRSLRSSRRSTSIMRGASRCSSARSRPVQERGGDRAA